MNSYFMQTLFMLPLALQSMTGGQMSGFSGTPIPVVVGVLSGALVLFTAWAIIHRMGR